MTNVSTTQLFQVVQLFLSIIVRVARNSMLRKAGRHFGSRNSAVSEINKIFARCARNERNSAACQHDSS